MDKINPQPEPPGGVFNIFGWLRYLFGWFYWILSLPFSRLL